MLDESSSEDTPPGGLVLSPPVDNRSTQAVRDSPPSSDWNEHWTAEIRRPVSSPDSEAWHEFRDEEIAALSAAPESEERKVSDQPRPECRPFSLKILLEKFFRNPGFNAVIKCFALAHFLKRNFPRQKVPSRRNSLKLYESPSVLFAYGSCIKNWAHTWFVYQAPRHYGAWGPEQAVPPPPADLPPAEVVIPVLQPMDLHSLFRAFLQ
jgi:hypothetical protein